MDDERITKLEIHFATMSTDMKHLLRIVEELKSFMMAISKLETICAACMARQDERWMSHRRSHEQVATVDDLARVADRVADYKASANGTARRLEGTKEKLTETRISIAKILGAGASGGAAVVGLIELIKFLVT